MSRESALGQIVAARGTVPRDRIEAAVHAFTASYAVKDWAARAALLSNDVVFEDTVGVPPPAIGRDAAATYFRQIIDLGWDLTMTPQRIVVMGNEAFVLTRGVWGERGDVPAVVDLIHNFRFNEAGEIAHVRVVYDEGCLVD